MAFVPNGHPIYLPTEGGVQQSRGNLALPNVLAHQLRAAMFEFFGPSHLRASCRRLLGVELTIQRLGIAVRLGSGLGTVEPIPNCPAQFSPQQ